MRMVIRVAVLSFVVFLLIWISTSMLQGRFFSKEVESDRFVGQGWGFVNKTWLADTGENNIDTGDPGEQDVDTGEIGGHSVKASDPGDPGFEFSTMEGQGNWSQRQLKRVRRLKNVCSRHQERSSFIESEKRR